MNKLGRSINSNLYDVLHCYRLHFSKK